MKTTALVVPVCLALASSAFADVEITPPAAAVSASSQDDNVPGNTVDGNLSTRWSANGDGQWIRFDLGALRTLRSIGVAAHAGNTRRNRFDIQISADGTSWSTVIADARTSGTTTAEETFGLGDVSARAVRYLGHGNDALGKESWNSVSEISLFTPDTAPTPTPTFTPTPAPTSTPTPASGTPIDITPGASGVSASTHDGNLPANTVDDNLATRWSANGNGAWIQHDLGAPQTISYVRIAVYSGNARRNQFDLQVRNGTTWSTVITAGLTSGTTTQLETHDFADVTGSAVRYVGYGSTVGTFNSLAELQVWGSPCSDCPTPTPTPRATPTATPRSTPTPSPTPTPGSGTIHFQSEGSKTHFPNYPQNPQNRGRIDDVSSPTYKGSTAIRFEQTYVDNATERYHSEVTIHGVQRNGQDKYYGFALYLPTTWHNESVKDNFQQWGSENPGGPWLLMWIDQDHIKGGHPNTFGTTDFGAISKGVWHRVVSRLRMQNGTPFEFWVDGTRRGAPNCSCSVTGGSVRWSAGIYVSYWYDRYRGGLPAGSQRTRYLLQDHYRITSSYPTADPASW
jgi:hypothetical protein